MCAHERPELLSTGERSGCCWYFQATKLCAVDLVLVPSASVRLVEGELLVEAAAS